MWAKVRMALASFVFVGGVLLLSGTATRLLRAQAQPSTPSAAQIKTVAARPDAPKGAASAGEQAASAKYVGSDTCKTCHEDVYQGWEKTPHWKITYRHTNNQGCESCHGPGSEHVDSGGQTPPPFDFLKMSARQTSERCLSCHESGKQQMNFEHSTHAENGVTCTNCHSPHHAVEAQTLLAKKQPELCYTCHLKEKAQFSMFFHHRVEEGLVKCSDCHNPHGGFVPERVRSASAQDAVCFTCHVDKQGPFVFEHPVVKVEGCESCHLPHGSPNPHLLKTSNLNVLCLKCHTGSLFSTASGTPDFHNQAGPYQACTICHEAIHGSNFDRHFLK